MADPVEKPKDLGGRPRIEFTDETWRQIESMCQLHCTATEIAGVLDISIDTLEARIKERYDLSFPEYFAKKSAGGKMSLRRRQYTAAMAGNPTMMVWLGKNWLKQTDKLEVSGDQEKPLNLSYRLDKDENTDA